MQSFTTTTDAQGKADSAIITAGPTTGDVLIAACASADPCPSSGVAASSLTIVNAPPTEMTITGGDYQSAHFGDAFANPLKVTVLDATGHPAGGAVTVEFQVLEGAVTFVDGSTLVDVALAADGTAASPLLIAGFTLGTTTVEVTVLDSAVAPQTFTGTVTAPVSVKTSAVSGSGQVALPGQQFAEPLVVSVVDENDEPIRNTPVTYVVTGPATLGGWQTFTANTDNSGQTSVMLTAGSPSQNGTVIVTATAANSTGSATFDAEVLVPAQLNYLNGDAQWVWAGQKFPLPLTVQVVDTSSSPLPIAGLPVVFTVSEGGVSFGGASEVTVATNDVGAATSPTLTAGSGAGTFTVVATYGTLSFSFTVYVEVDSAACTACGGTGEGGTSSVPENTSPVIATSLSSDARAGRLAVTGSDGSPGTLAAIGTLAVGTGILRLSARAWRRGLRATLPWIYEAAD